MLVRVVGAAKEHCGSSPDTDDNILGILEARIQRHALKICTTNIHWRV